MHFASAEPDSCATTSIRASRQVDFLELDRFSGAFLWQAIARLLVTSRTPLLNADCRTTTSCMSNSTKYIRQIRPDPMQKTAVTPYTNVHIAAIAV